ncbi:MAG: alpha-1,2-fucosyltransferase [Bacteroidetes bacterium]|nr:alpha-1,2-fucosyltransferase [bacterium]NBP64859.1 alpha-1,2-fucosyltransferase [Bacteroidota bacterium]
MHNHSIVSLSGGLGNQLFQYSYSKYLAKNLNQPVFLDVSWYRFNQSSEGRRLFLTDLVASGLNLTDTSNLIERGFLRATSSLRGQNAYRSHLNYIAKGMTGLQFINDEPLIKNVSKDSYYQGSFSLPHYWTSASISLRDELSNCLEGYANRIQRSFTQEHDLNIHVRRGDYVTSPKTRSFHGYCSTNFYLESVEKLISEFSTIKSIQIFSDSDEFAQKLRISLQTFSKAISVNNRNDSLLALRDLSNSKFLIGSNSTFSWWAHALGSHQLSYFPSKWLMGVADSLVTSENFIGPVVLVNEALQDGDES